MKKKIGRLSSGGLNITMKKLQKLEKFKKNEYLLNLILPMSSKPISRRCDKENTYLEGQNFFAHTGYKENQKTKKNLRFKYNV